MLFSSKHIGTLHAENNNYIGQTKHINIHELDRHENRVFAGKGMEEYI
jgi:hypothetical protein